MLKPFGGLTSVFAGFFTVFDYGTARYGFQMRIHIGFSVVCLVLSFCVHGASGQALIRTDSSAFDRFTSCKFSDGLTVVETSPLTPGIHARTVQTLKGPRQIEMVEGRRVMFAYPEKDFYIMILNPR